VPLISSAQPMSPPNCLMSRTESGVRPAASSRIAHSRVRFASSGTLAADELSFASLEQEIAEQGAAVWLDLQGRLQAHADDAMLADSVRKMFSEAGVVRGHVIVLAGGQVEVTAGGQIYVPTASSLVVSSGSLSPGR